MYTTNRTLPRKFLAITMAIVMALTMTVSAFASDVRPNNLDTTDIIGSINYTAQTYTVNITGAADATKITFNATLYKKELLGRKEISSMTGSSNGRVCSKSKSATIEKGKTYAIEVTAKVYSGGVWDTVEKTLTVKT